MFPLEAVVSACSVGFLIGLAAGAFIVYKSTE